MAFAVGIDLGTTNTVVAAVGDGVVATLADVNGDRLLPSIVSIEPSGSVLVGRGAAARRLTDVENTIYSVKRLIGRLWSSPEVQKARAVLPFALREGPKGACFVAARGDTFSLPEISAFVLRQAKAIAESALGGPVERAVITVPANFNDLQRAATKTAGRLAGLEVLRILNEPTAAALAYGPRSAAQERVVVYDLGGGTFDVTVLDLVGNVFEVLSTAGDTALGGDDIDLVVAQRMAEDVQRKLGFDSTANPTGFTRLRLLGEEMKRELSTKTEHVVATDDLGPTKAGASASWRFRMTRPELEWASLALVDRTIDVCRSALESASVAPSEIDRVILVGGATRMPMIARKVEQFFGRAPVVTINPDEVVALGAAIQAELLDRSRGRRPGTALHPQIAHESVVKPLPSDSGAATEALDMPNLPVVRAGVPPPRPPLQARPPPAPPPVPRPPAPPPAPPAVPAVSEFLPGRATKSLVFDVPAPPSAPAFEIELDVPSRGRNPPPSAPRKPDPPALPPVLTDRSPPPIAVSAVAPVERSSPRRAPLLIDVTPLSLNVETVGGFCDVLIDANTPVPCDRTRSFATASDGQTTVCVRIAQGSSHRFEDNTFLGELELSGLTSAARGDAPIAVTFEIDADGILNVKAREVKTGRETEARIQLAGAETDPREIQAMRDRQANHPIARSG